MNVFSALNKEEIEHLRVAAALVTILIGSADGSLDGEERNWSEKLLRARSYSGKKELQDFYLEVAEGLWVDLQHLMSVLPADAEQRNQEIGKRLEGLNAIFPKLSSDIAYALYKGLLGLADEIAKASGGFLRIGAVSAKEQSLLKLPMIYPIAAPPGAEEAAQGRFDENIWGEKLEDES